MIKLTTDTGVKRNKEAKRQRKGEREKRRGGEKEPP
jgi:hypothetical protein